MIFLAKLGVGVISTALVAGAALSSEGFIHVKVHEKQPGGTHLNLIVPAALVPASLSFIPKHHLAHASEQLHECLPIIDAAVPALEDAPDGVLVEVSDPGQHVLITKSGGSIVIDVNDPGDEVHVSVPLRAAQSSIHLIAEANEGE
jgi:hypothetical protein